MAKDATIEVDRIVGDFLDQNLDPTLADWRKLIDAHPEFAAQLAEASIVFLGQSPEDDMEAPENVDIDQNLFSKTLSHAINLLHEIPSTMVEEAQKKVAAAKGPATRRLSMLVGLGPNPALLNGILVGRVLAPVVVMRALEEQLQTPAYALAEVFRRSFEDTAVPQYKADKTPEIAVHPQSWEESVKELSLGEEERARLLALAEEG